MGAFSAFPFLGAVEVVARSQLCLILKVYVPMGKKGMHTTDYHMGLSEIRVLIRERYGRI